MEKKLCPSAPFKKGHNIFGELINDSFIFKDELTKIDEDTFSSVSQSDNKNNYRVSMTCATKGCGNWNGSKCTVPDQMKNFIPADKRSIQPCPIRNACRWFAQDGESACGICPLIKTDFDFYTGDLNTVS